MRIPKYVQKMIDRRRKLADELNKVSVELDEWLEKNGFNVYTDYTCTGILIYTEPGTARNNVMRDILKR